MSSRKRIAICGGGAIGAAIAYFTARRGAQPIVIERHQVAGAASGKSGGFLALDWCAGTPARSAGAAELRPSRRPFFRAGKYLGTPPSDDVRR
jgi:glycine/D-amino acid oxidase-like deaminating enzyme